MSNFFNDLRVGNITPTLDDSLPPVEYPAFLYNLKHRLGYHNIDGGKVISLYFKHFEDTITPYEDPQVLEWISSSKVFRLPQLSSSLIANSIDYVLNTDGISIPKIVEHYQIQMYKYLSVHNRRSKDRYIQYVKETLPRLSSLLDYLFSLEKRYTYVFTREVFNWYDGLNYYYGHLPALASKDGEVFDVFLVVNAKLSDNHGVKNLTQLPSVNRMLGFLANKEIIINDVNIVALSCNVDSRVSFNAFSKVTYKKLYKEEDYINFIKVYADPDSWKTPIAHYLSYSGMNIGKKTLDSILHTGIPVFKQF